MPKKSIQLFVDSVKIVLIFNMNFRHFEESYKNTVPLCWYTTYNKAMRQELFQLLNSESDCEMYFAANFPKHLKGVTVVYVFFLKQFYCI